MNGLGSGGAIRVMHVITDLGLGGAETMLAKLLGRTDRSRFEPAVVSLRGRGHYGDRLEAAGVPVHCLGMVPPWPSLSGLRSFLGFARRWRPDVVQGWMYHPNLLVAALAPLLPGRPAVCWNIRQSLHDLAAEKPSSRLVIRATARLARRPAAIVYNSRVSVGQHVALGYPADRTRVIFNGFEGRDFAPSPAARARVRAELAIADDAFVIGLIGRFHPQKDHATFLAAAGRTATRDPDARFVLAGSGTGPDNAALTALVQAAGLDGRVARLGERTDIAAVTAALDTSTLCSAFIEGFPNVVGEAMACGVPCVVTDIGDSAWIVGDTGLVVPCRDPDALAAAGARIAAMSPRERAAAGERARARILADFSLDRIVGEYEALYQSVASSRGERRPQPAAAPQGAGGGRAVP